MKLHTISFGCQMNVADSEEMARPLLERGYALSPALEDADAVLVNTCTVRDHAEHRALSLLGRLKAWKDERPERFVIVAGCAAERLKDELKRRFPHVDLVVGAKAIEDYPRMLDEALRERYDLSREDAEAFPAASPLNLAPSPVIGYITIMRGCNYSCSYCIVPAVRGRELYRPWDSILEEARAKAAAGAREILLLGQTVNSYRDPGGRGDFADLLRAVGGVEGVKRIRFMSPHPYYLTDRVIDAMAETPAVAGHLHLPVQSGSDPMLKAMRRNYTRAQYLERLARLRARLPEIAVTTDFIVGFPAESEADFSESLSLVDEADLDTAYCFKFSAREGTQAASMGPEVPEDVKAERLARLLARVEARTERKIAAMMGRRLEVLVEEPGAGRARSHWKVRLESRPEVGSLVSARVTSTRGTSLTACVEEGELLCAKP